MLGGLEATMGEIQLRATDMACESWGILTMCKSTLTTFLKLSYQDHFGKDRSKTGGGGKAREEADG